MTPEEAYFHMILLRTGHLDIYDDCLLSYLEKEDPLSDIVLSLSFCDTLDKTIDCLYDYTIDKKINMQTVAEHFRFYVKERYENGSMTAGDCVAAFYSFLPSDENRHEKPWSFWDSLSDCYWYACSSTDDMNMPLPASLEKALAIYLETGKMTKLDCIHYLNFSHDTESKETFFQKIIRIFFKRK